MNKITDFKKGDIILDGKNDDLFYMVDSVHEAKQGRYEVCALRLNDKYFYSLPLEEVRFYYNVEMMGD